MLLRNSLIIFLFIAVLLKADCLEYLSSTGYVDWSNGKIYAKGIGLPNPKLPEAAALFGARRAALIDARRNLLEAIGGVRIDSESVIVNKMNKSDHIRAVVSGVVKNSFPLKFTIHKDNVVEATVVAPLAGSIMSLFYPKNLYSDINTLLNNQNFNYHIDRLPMLALNDDRVLKQILKRLDRLENIVFEKKEFKKDYNKISGVIIDARGTNFIPSLKPKIYQIGTNKPLYPDGVMLRDDIVNNFSALFVTSLKDAMSHPRVSPYPLVIKGLKTYGKWRNCIVLGTQASKKFKKYIHSEALRAGKVIIVISK